MKPRRLRGTLSSMHRRVCHDSQAPRVRSVRNSIRQQAMTLRILHDNVHDANINLEDSLTAIDSTAFLKKRIDSGLLKETLQHRRAVAALSQRLILLELLGMLLNHVLPDL
eukprot:IDg16726t1